MLQQILRDMYIDPELLAELDEEQKQILFCKMRQEQKRRWEERECRYEREEMKKAKSPKANRKGNNVIILEGADKNPWTWVMGEHPDDATIEEMIELESIKRARSLVERELKTFSQYSSNMNQKNGPLLAPETHEFSCEESPTTVNKSVDVICVDEKPVKGQDVDCSPGVSEESPSTSPVPVKLVSPAEETISIFKASTSPEIPLQSETPLVFNPIERVLSDASHSISFAAKPQQDEALDRVVQVQDIPKDSIDESSQASHVENANPSTPSPAQSFESTSFVECRPVTIGSVVCSEFNGRRQIDNEVASANKVLDLKGSAKSDFPHPKDEPAEEMEPSISRRSEFDAFKPESGLPLESFNQSPVSPKSLSVSETIAKLNIRAPLKKGETSQSKPLDRSGRTTRANFIPKHSNKELPNSSETSVKEEKSSEARERFGKTFSGSVVEKAKVDINTFRQKRMQEIVSGIQSERQKSLERATKDSKNIVQLWLAQEKKAKEADEERKMIARRVREDNARAMRRLRTESQVLSLFTDDPTKPGYSIHNVNQSMQRVQRPNCVAEVMAWYQEVELKRGAGLDPGSGTKAPYYYGMLSRKDAERKLAKRQEGTFLVRLSAQIFGYAVSLRGSDSFHNIKNIRHYLIEVTDSGYQFFGANQPTFQTLHDFIEHYKKKPLSLVTSDRLKMECGLIKDDDDDDDDDGNESSSSSSSDSVLDC